ncbi:DUF938 domain-containing protein [Jannaschia formosa]|uniref:DUF938 domain-containing protein n=1 Tax=Jannaschia formosa TaxID=2259592 RepID=UPI000E1C3C29|nr:DUF938 domain-containing protein [Jannaschia formosa]TFL20109.1 DUF938 domain-containing protein [Jannaschia formosa]
MRRANPPEGPPAPDAEGLMTSPAAARNLAPILDVLLPHLPRKGEVLEIASGTGEHVAAFAAHRPDLTFRPSDPDPTRRRAIDARCRGLPNVAAAIDLDACESGWANALGPVEAVIVVNLLHLISDGEMSVLLDEAGRILGPSGRLAIYGPFLRDGMATSEGDAGFHAALQAQDPAIGLKDIEVVTTVLGVLDLSPQVVEMPANNLMILGRRGTGVPGL